MRREGELEAAGCRIQWGWEERLGEKMVFEQAAKRNEGESHVDIRKGCSRWREQASAKALRLKYAWCVWGTIRGLGAWIRVNERGVVGN